MDKFDELYKAFKDRMEAEAKEKEAADKAIAKEAEITSLKEKVEKLEKASATGRSYGDVSVGAPDMYKGYNFKKQFSDNPNYAPKDPKVKEAVIKEALDFISRYTRKTAMGEGVSGYGDDFAPEQWVASIEEMARLQSIALSDCRRFPMVSDVIHIPKQGTSATVTWANEGSASSESEPGSDQLSLTAKRVGLWGVISQELLDDANVDVVGYITRDVVEVFGQEIDSQVFNGNQFTGIFDISNPSSVTFGATNTGTSYKNMVAQNFYDARALLPKVRRAGAKWYMAPEVFATCAGLNTGTGGVPLVNYLGAEQSTMLAGFPVVEVEAISGVDATSTPFICFANLQNYALGARLLATGIELNRMSETHFKQYQVLYRFYARIIGAPIHDSMFVLLETA